MANVPRRATLGAIDRLFRVGTVSGLSDAQLLERFARRHDEAAEAAFAALVERHGPMVLRVCRRVLNDPHDAQDAFQATFLVLMRKARSVRRRESVGSWLYGVARRVSVRALAAAARRRVVEKEAVRPQFHEAKHPDLDREVWDEVDRLGEAQRAAVVLCYLEGLTHEQAAHQLGWPVGTVRSRLARARDRLRRRLERKGYAAADHGSLAGLLVAVTRAPASLPLPGDIVNATARAALTLAARDAVEAGLVSVSAASLTEGMVRTMILAKLKTAAFAVIAAGSLATGAGVYAYQPPKENPDTAPQAESLIRTTATFFATSAPQQGDPAKVVTHALQENAAESGAKNTEIALRAIQTSPADRVTILAERAREQQKAGHPGQALETLAKLRAAEKAWENGLQKDLVDSANTPSPGIVLDKDITIWSTRARLGVVPPQPPKPATGARNPSRDARSFTPTTGPEAPQPPAQPEAPQPPAPPEAPQPPVRPGGAMNLREPARPTEGGLVAEPAVPVQPPAPPEETKPPDVAPPHPDAPPVLPDLPENQTSVSSLSNTYLKRVVGEATQGSSVMVYPANPYVAADPALAEATIGGKTPALTRVPFQPDNVPVTPGEPPPSDTEHRLSEVERKLDRILQALEGRGQDAKGSVLMPKPTGGPPIAPGGDSLPRSR